MLPIEPHFFKAVLKTQNDQYLADGSATVCVAEKSVEFRSQFVPLLPLGAQAKIVRVIDGRETHCFEGSVYLSSSTLMRLVDVNDQLLTEVELEAMQNVTIPAQVSPYQTQNGLFQFAAKRLARFEAEVFSISLTRLRFVCSEEFMEGERVSINLGPPLELTGLTVEIKQQLLFGEKKIGYRCDLLPLDPEQKMALIGFLSKRMQVFRPGPPPHRG